MRDHRRHESEARERMLSRDVDDWPSVALAESRDVAIWTNDSDFAVSGLDTSPPRSCWHDLTDGLDSERRVGPVVGACTGEDR